MRIWAPEQAGHRGVALEIDAQTFAALRLLGALQLTTNRQTGLIGQFGTFQIGANIRWFVPHSHDAVAQEILYGE